MATKLKVLFLCTGNSCRSQMAEGWARRLKGDVIEPYSAGIEAHGLNPRAVKVMAEAGVDISRQRSKTRRRSEGRAFRLRRHRLRPRARELPDLPGQGEGRARRLRRSAAPGQGRQDRRGGAGALPARAGRDPRVRRAPSGGIDRRGPDAEDARALPVHGQLLPQPDGRGLPAQARRRPLRASQRGAGARSRSIRWPCR